MSVTIKNGLLEEAVESMQKLRRGNRFKGRTRLEIVAALKVLSEAWATYQLARNDLIEQHGRDGRVKSDMPTWEEFRAEHDELANADAVIELQPLEFESLLHDPDATFGEELDVLVELGVIRA